MTQPIHNSKFQKLLRRVLSAGLVVLLALGWLYSDLALKLFRAERPYIYHAGYDLPRADLVQATALNYRTAAADLVWIDGVQFVAKSMVAKRNADAVTDYAETLIALDPYFYKVYSWHSAARMLAVGYPTPADIEVANDILELGMKWFPGDWRLAYEATVNYIGFNKDTDDMTRIAQLKRGIEFAERAAAIPGSPEIMASLALSFRSRLQLLEREQRGEEVDEADPRAAEIEREMLIHLYSMSSNEKSRESILQRLQHAGGAEELVERLQAHRRSQRDWHQNSRLDYLPFELFSLVQAPGSATLETIGSGVSWEKSRAYKNQNEVPGAMQERGAGGEKGAAHE